MLLLPRLRRRLEGWLLWRAPECQVAFVVIAETTRGVAALASPRVPSCFCRDCGDDSRGGCSGEPPSAKLLLPRLLRRHEGLLLWRAPECQVAFAAIAETTRGVAALASPRVLTIFDEKYLYNILPVVSYKE